MEYISMLLGLAVVVILMIRSWSPIIIGIAAAAVVIFLNGMPYGDTMTNVFFPAFAGMFESLFPVIFSGSLIAETYKRSGAVVVIADRFCNLMFRDGLSATKRYVMAILSMVVVSGVICYCGMNSLVMLMAMYPIALRIMERADIPKRFVMGILSGGVYTFAMSAPGSAEVVNNLAMQALGTPSYAGLCGGIFAAVVEVTVMTTVMTLMIKRDVAHGAHFEYGPKDVRYTGHENAKKPALLAALAPLVALIVLFNFFGFSIFMATMVAWLLSVALFWKHIGGKNGFLACCAEGGKAAFGPVSSVGAIVGFTSVVQTLPAFQELLDAIFALNVPAVVILILAISLVAGLTGSSSSAIRVGIPLISAQCQEAGLSTALIHRVSCYACSTIDTLPWSTAIIINLGIADLKMKDGYPPMFVATCLATVCGTVACAAFMYLFPNLP
jgi:H+/gluconate symporter-like permease